MNAFVTSPRLEEPEIIQRKHKYISENYYGKYEFLLYI